MMETRKAMESIKNEEREEKLGLSVHHKSGNLTGGNSVGRGCFFYQIHQN